MTTAQTPTDNDAIRTVLGPDPAEGSVSGAIVVLSIMAGLIVACFSIGTATKAGGWLLCGIVLSIIFIIAVPASIILILKVLYCRKAYYRPAFAALQSGALNATWAAQGLDGEGIIAVDEFSKKVFINVKVFNFVDVKKIEWPASGKRAFLRIIVRVGESPVYMIPLKSHDDAMHLGHRLHNALDLGGTAIEDADMAAKVN